jgi:DNA repair protein RadD
MRQHWPEAPLGIYSAGMGQRDIGEPITFAGIQSVRNKSDQIGHVDLVLIDECHLVSHKQEGGYRKLIDNLTRINPALRVIGLTATPYRMGHGYITDAPALFSAIIAPVSIEELIYKKHLAPLRSKLTDHALSVDGVHKRGGEYIESELQAAVDTEHNNVATVDEVIKLAGERRSWLFFCAGVKHAHNVADALIQRGITAATIVGETPKAERERIVADFKAGKIKALTNANVLTTGFDHPDLDLIAMLRPTLSTGLYVQMAGRGMRPKSHTDHCLVLDFAGVVQTHGPITAVKPKKANGKGDGEAPVKVCKNCKELNHISAKECIVCGEPFPPPPPLKYRLHDDDIMGLGTTEMAITDWQWRRHTSRASGKEMLRVTYYGALSDKPINEYLTICHDGYAGDKARISLATIASSAGVPNVSSFEDTLEGLAYKMNESTPPASISFRQDGKFYRVLRREWQ